MTRFDYERTEAAQRGHTVDEMRQLGYWSAICECRADDCVGFQTVNVPADAPEFERRVVLKQLAGLEPRPFGEGGDST